MQKTTAAFIRILLAIALSAVSGTVAAQGSLADFEQALRDTGWSVQRDNDGSLILRPREISSNDTAQDRRQRMQRELQAAGWNVEREADGTLLLVPPGRAKAETVDPMQGIKRKLRQTGWIVSSGDDGSMLLYPPGKSAPGKPAAVAGIPPRVQVALPVDNWREAYDISRSWLESQPAFGAIVGKIRKIFHVYLVSIVAENKPHRLLQQIVVRDSDGSVIVLN